MLKTLNKIVPVLGLALFVTITHAAPQAETPGVYSVGGVMIKVAAPEGFHDPAASAPEITELALKMVPPVNRLLAAYVSPSDITNVAMNKAPEMTRYFSAQVPKPFEQNGLSQAEFALAVQQLADQNEKLLQQIKPATQKKLDELAGTLGDAAEDKTFSVKMGEILPLGIFHRSADTITIGSLSQFSTVIQGKPASYMVATAYSVLHVKGKVLFQYTFTQYRSKDDIEWAKQTALAWAEATKRLNRRRRATWRTKKAGPQAGFFAAGTSVAYCGEIAPSKPSVIGRFSSPVLCMPTGCSTIPRHLKYRKPLTSDTVTAPDLSLLSHPSNFLLLTSANAILAFFCPGLALAAS